MRRLLLTGASGFIGTNLVEAWAGDDVTFLNLDRSAPLHPSHRIFWQEADLLQPERWAARARAFAPTDLIHLAARTDMDEKTTPETGYRINIEGTRLLLEVAQSLPSLQRLVLVSSQFVCGPGYLPRHDEDFAPVTVYGQSKALAEQALRRTPLPCPWIIVRPTNVWGPWHPRYPREFWRVLRRGWYVHPSGPPVLRAYAYVGNLLRQMRAALDLPAGQVRGSVFYLSDPVEDISRWVDAFSLALRGAPARRIPRWALRLFGWLGDGIEGTTGRPFYISSSRVRSMTSDYPVPLEKTFQVLGRGPFSLEDGVRTTVHWLRKTLPQEFTS